jgi:hypothetical protein
MLLPLEPLVDVALEPVVAVPAEPVTGALGATGALLGVVLPVDVLGGLPAPNGVTFGTAARPGGWTPGWGAAALPAGSSLRARHSWMYRAFCRPV